MTLGMQRLPLAPGYVVVVVVVVVARIGSVEYMQGGRYSTGAATTPLASFVAPLSHLASINQFEERR